MTKGRNEPEWKASARVAFRQKLHELVYAICNAEYSLSHKIKWIGELNKTILDASALNITKAQQMTSTEIESLEHTLSINDHSETIRKHLLRFLRFLKVEEEYIPAEKDI